ncbi:MAG: DinB family protein [Anaerolineales bacterium]|jgi:uncharacterized damage-inducible protein DinB
MITASDLSAGYALNVRLIKRQTEGLSHADSLIQTPYNINSLNWVLGHIAVNRDNVLRALGVETLLTEAQTQRYIRDSEPVRQDGPDILKLEELLELLERGQAIIESEFKKLTPESLEREIEIGERSVTLGSRLFGLYFHDTYHTGQTDLLRQVAGINDKVI